jgi:hypothetical protein
MIMRFRGGGVGHKSTSEATRCLFNDRDPLDDADAIQERRDHRHKEANINGCTSELDADSDDLNDPSGEDLEEGDCSSDEDSEAGLPDEGDDEAAEDMDEDEDEEADGLEGFGEF